MATVARSVQEREARPLTLRLLPAVRLSDEQLFELCRLNRELRIERTSAGELSIMTPTGGETGARSSEINFQLRSWAKEDDTGVAFDSSTGFLLPNGAVRSPDASWVRRSRLAPLSPGQKKVFLPLCPDFVIEIRSPSDDPRTLQRKLQEYVDNGATLGLLIDPEERQVLRYVPGAAPEILQAPAAVSCEPVLPGFTLQLQEVWNLSW